MHGLFSRSLALTTLAFAAWGGCAQATTIHLVLSESTPPYVRFAEALEEALQVLPSPPTLRRVPVAQYRPERGEPSAQWVAVGTRAAEQLGRSPPTGPVLCALVPRETMRRVSRDPGWRLPEDAFDTLYIDQPFGRQLALIRAALPAARRVLALVTPGAAQGPDLAREAAKLDMELLLSPLDDPDELIPLLSRGLETVEAFLALPDPGLTTGRGIQNLLLATYRHGVPVFAYSRSFVHAGAAAAVYSTPEQLGRHAGEVLAKQLRSRHRPAAGSSYPRYYEVSVNERVARSLGLPVPDAEQLKSAISSFEGDGLDE